MSGIMFLSKQAETAPSAAILIPSGTTTSSVIPAPTIVTILSEIRLDSLPLGLYNLEIKRDETFSRDLEKPNWRFISS